LSGYVELPGRLDEIVVRHDAVIGNESRDLVHLDPPLNSNGSHDPVFAERDGTQAVTLIAGKGGSSQRFLGRSVEHMVHGHRAA
jgi:hypothetical protein